MSFHDTRFPTAISRGAHGGPERRTDVVVLGSGAEERNARWADSRRSYNAGYGVKSLDDLHAVIAFFEERRGRLHGFRWRDPADCKSCPPRGHAHRARPGRSALGDGATAAFQLVKTYGAAFNPWTRAITKPVAGTVLVAVDGVAADARHRTTPSTTPPASSPSSPATSPPPAPSSPPASSSTCPSASTPTSSRSTSRASATAPSRASPSSRSGCDGHADGRAWRVGEPSGTRHPARFATRRLATRDLRSP